MVFSLLVSPFSSCQYRNKTLLESITLTNRKGGNLVSQQNCSHDISIEIGPLLRHHVRTKLTLEVLSCPDPLKLTGNDRDEGVRSINLDFWELKK